MSGFSVGGPVGGPVGGTTAFMESEGEIGMLEYGGLAVIWIKESTASRGAPGDPVGGTAAFFDSERFSDCHVLLRGDLGTPTYGN